MLPGAIHHLLPLIIKNGGFVHGFILLELVFVLVFQWRMLDGFGIMKDLTVCCSLLKPICTAQLFLDLDLAQNYVVVIRVLQKDIAVDLREGLHGFVADLLREAWCHVTLLVAFTLFGI